ncbi:MAG: wax ester/triacylglycerol synthase family O-acyltransferase, partial [Hyphomicrobiales bacterium]|nr:wax ester/triacylglycerol synthase family O-acyltransferase [Hyphomicrobiales bacterium]
MSETFDRLTQLDNSFLVYEDAQPHAAMHVASTQIHDARPLRLDDGSLDIERIQEYVLSRLDRIPRYRQRLARTPIEGHPVWIDDASFNIHYHVRHSRLPSPGNERQLKRMAGRIFSQRLDREKPLWELWIIEGLSGDRLAVVSKVHHCMVDGVSGSELISALLTSEPQEKPDPTRPWHPRDTPSATTLGMSEVNRVVRAPVQAAEAMARLLRDEDDDRHDLSERVRALGRMLGNVSGARALPFNEPIGPHRRLDWTPISMAEIKEVRRAVGGTVNDIVLAVTAGAVRHYLTHTRGMTLHDESLRVMAPVSVRRKDERGDLGNRVSAWTLDLPINEPDPLTRLETICQATAELKETKQALGAEILTQATEWTGSGLLSLGARLIVLGTPFNMVVTNVPGPRVPLFLIESPLLEIHPHVP